MKKNQFFFNKNHILHRLDDLTHLITLPELVTQPQVPHILTHAKLITCVSGSGYLCDVYDPPTLYKKKFNFFNMGHNILHRLDDLTDVI